MMGRLRTMNRRKWRKITPVNGIILEWRTNNNSRLTRRLAVLRGGKWRAGSLRPHSLSVPGEAG